MEFPAECRIRPTDQGFDLSEHDGSCSFLSDVSFVAQQQ
jgi:hypothetical protein